MKEREKVKRELECELDDHYRLKYGEQLVDHLAAVARAKRDIKAHQKEADRLVLLLAEGTERRTVDCQEIPDYDNCVMRLCRLDTYETLSERRMTDEERNGNLFAPKPEQEKSPAGETNKPEGETIEASGETTTDQEAAPAPEGELEEIEKISSAVVEGINEGAGVNQEQPQTQEQA